MNVAEVFFKYLHRSQTQTEVNSSIKRPRQLSLTMNFQASPSWRPASSWQIDWVRALEKVQVTDNQLLAPDYAQTKVCSTISIVQKCFCNFVFQTFRSKVGPVISNVSQGRIKQAVEWREPEWMSKEEGRRRDGREGKKKEREKSHRVSWTVAVRQ